MMWLKLFAMWLAIPFIVVAAVFQAFVEGIHDLYGRG